DEAGARQCGRSKTLAHGRFGLPRGARTAQAQDESLKRACWPVSSRSQVAGNSARERRDAEAQSEGPAPSSRTNTLKGWSRPPLMRGLVGLCPSLRASPSSNDREVV